jgi:hypothetical protein
MGVAHPRSVRTTRLIGAAMLLPVLLLAAVALPSSVLRCRFTGLAVPTCCCPDEMTDGPAVATLSAAACCDRETIDVVRAPAERQTSPTDLVAGAFVTSDVRGELPLARPFVPAAAARDADLPRPPLLLVKHAFLI